MENEREWGFFKSDYRKTIRLTKAQMGEILDNKCSKGEFEKHYRDNGGTQVLIFKKMVSIGRQLIVISFINISNLQLIKNVKYFLTFCIKYRNIFVDGISNFTNFCQPL